MKVTVDENFKLATSTLWWTWSHVAICVCCFCCCSMVKPKNNPPYPGMKTAKLIPRCLSIPAMRLHGWCPILLGKYITSESHEIKRHRFYVCWWKHFGGKPLLFTASFCGVQPRKQIVLPSDINLSQGIYSWKWHLVCFCSVLCVKRNRYLQCWMTAHKQTPVIKKWVTQTGNQGAGFCGVILDCSGHFSLIIHTAANISSWEWVLL